MLKLLTKKSAFMEVTVAGRLYLPRNLQEEKP
jgi:hypothetical protein